MIPMLLTGRDCPMCDGTGRKDRGRGKVWYDTCAKCAGDGLEREPLKTEKVRAHESYAETEAG